MGDAAHCGGAQIHVGLGLDLAGAADHRDQILAYDLGGQDFGVASLLPIDEKGHKSNNHHGGESDQKYLLHLRCVLRVSPISVYAIRSGTVPCACQILPLPA